MPQLMLMPEIIVSCRERMPQVNCYLFIYWIFSSVIFFVLDFPTLSHSIFQVLSMLHIQEQEMTSWPLLVVIARPAHDPS